MLNYQILLSRTFTLLTLYVIITAFLSACATKVQQPVSRRTTTLLYTQGFDDGCSSGKKSAGDIFSRFQRNDREFQTSEDYRKGWHDGHRKCKDEWLSTDHQQKPAEVKQKQPVDKRSPARDLKVKEDQQYLPRLNPLELEELKKLAQ